MPVVVAVPILSKRRRRRIELVSDPDRSGNFRRAAHSICTPTRAAALTHMDSGTRLPARVISRLMHVSN